MQFLNKFTYVWLAGTEVGAVFRKVSYPMIRKMAVFCVESVFECKPFNSAVAVIFKLTLH
jgi:hypothetical protein